MRKYTITKKKKSRDKPVGAHSVRPKNKNPRAFTKWFVDLIIIISASAVYSYALHAFIAPADIAPGGVTGIATIVNSLTDIPVGVLYGLFNLPLIILGFIFLGKAMMVKTIISVAVITVATDFLFADFSVYTGDKMLAALFGGVLFGAAMGIIYLRNGTSGGIDIVNRMIHKKLPFFSLGKITLAADAVVISASMAVFRSVEAGLFAIIAIFVSGRVIDTLFYGGLEGKLLLIFSDKYEEITQKIITEQHRGVTLLSGTGAYSGLEKKVICCAVNKNQYVKIKRVVGETDPAAFIVITHAGEVLGEGFQPNRIS
ncbi:MAG: YitT family protein [Oscillospiraceae bacterium]|nr:YitT family protein [Oscillospiraceae bacterium]